MCHSICPGYAKIPYPANTSLPDPQPGWKITKVHKRNECGEWITNRANQRAVYTYEEDIETGNFYEYEVLGTERLAAVSGAIATFATLYGFAVMTANAIKIVVDIGRIAYEALTGFVKDIQEYSIRRAVGNFLLRIVIELPTSLFLDVWGIVRAPIFTVAMIIVGLYGLVDPLTARVWFDKVEYHWHDRRTYQDDIRHHRGETVAPAELWEDIKAGKIAFLTYCCTKRGHRDDKRFEIITNTPSRPFSGEWVESIPSDISKVLDTQIIEDEGLKDVAWGDFLKTSGPSSSAVAFCSSSSSSS